MTLLQKISELNSKGITVQFIPVKVLKSTKIKLIGNESPCSQTYTLGQHSITTSEEWLIVGIIGDMEKKLYKSNEYG